MGLLVVPSAVGVVESSVDESHGLHVGHIPSDEQIAPKTATGVTARFLLFFSDVSSMKRVHPRVS